MADKYTRAYSCIIMRMVLLLRGSVAAARASLNWLNLSFLRNTRSLSAEMRDVMFFIMSSMSAWEAVFNQLGMERRGRRIPVEVEALEGDVLGDEEGGGDGDGGAGEVGVAHHGGGVDVSDGVGADETAHAIEGELGGGEVAEEALEGLGMTGREGGIRGCRCRTPCRRCRRRWSRGCGSRSRTQS